MNAVGDGSTVGKIVALGKGWGVETAVAAGCGTSEAASGLQAGIIKAMSSRKIKRFNSITANVSGIGEVGQVVTPALGQELILRIQKIPEIF